MTNPHEQATTNWLGWDDDQDACLGTWMGTSMATVLFAWLIYERETPTLPGFLG